MRLILLVMSLAPSQGQRNLRPTIDISWIGPQLVPATLYKMIQWMLKGRQYNDCSEWPILLRTSSWIFIVWQRLLLGPTIFLKIAPTEPNLKGLFLETWFVISQTYIICVFFFFFNRNKYIYICVCVCVCARACARKI